MHICITAVKKTITSYGTYGIHLVSFTDEYQNLFENKKVWCNKCNVKCGDQLYVHQATEDDFQEL
jgi:hypothetical protein